MSSSIIDGAESCSSSSPNFKGSTNSNYDVFLSFRGEDTCSNFTSHLGMALRQRGLSFFIDDKLHRGKQISESLLKSIQESRVSIVIFSQNYASSIWCLDELVKIVECMESKGQIVLPVFYKVDPSKVRKQTGRFGEALAKYEPNKIERLEGSFDYCCCFVWLGSSIKVAKHPVGLDSQLRAIEELASHVVTDGVNMLGIHGMGGIGTSRNW
ncbi:unnamed protein product [Citrullus colocynthis]|uniref:ADP-ribosyl cyclase/cyclic ADP-ribose hydrolase n=1 Tax=Citrullus colocynthis TaxID=252529 RepID=A0ABP0XUP5_9ROSI